MEAWNDEQRVRPIPIDDDESSSSEPVRRASEDGNGPKRPWLPLVLAGIAVVIVVGSVGAFGAIQDDGPPSRDIAALTSATTAPDSSPTTTLGDSLGETIPGVQDRLTLIVIGDDGPAALLWDPSFILPKEIPLDTDPLDDAVYSASFDSGGRFIALAADIPGSIGSALYIGIPTDVGAVDLADVDSHVWHATEVGRLAWIGRASDGTKHLRTAKANPLGKSLTQAIDHGPIGDGEHLVRWDSRGFILADGTERVVLRDNESGLIATIDGTAVATSATTIVTAPAGSDPLRLTSATLRSRTGDIVETLDVEALGPSETEVDERIRTFSMSRNSDLLARIDVDPTRTRIEVRGPSLSALRILQHHDDVPPIGFTSNDRYFVFASDGNNDLVFVDWNIGSIHDLAIPDEYKVIAFDLG